VRGADGGKHTSEHERIRVGGSVDDDNREHGICLAMLSMVEVG
jgi:hypothetical protein